MDVEELKNRARSLEREGQLADAIALYRRVLAHCEQTGTITRELPLYVKAGDLAIKTGDRKLGLGLYGRAARRYAENGSARSVVALCTKIVRTAPTNTYVYPRLARLMIERGHIDAAREVLVDYAAKTKQAKGREALERLAGRPDTQVKGILEKLLDAAEKRERAIQERIKRTPPAPAAPETRPETAQPAAPAPRPTPEPAPPPSVTQPRRATPAPPEPVAEPEPEVPEVMPPAVEIEPSIPRAAEPEPASEAAPEVIQPAPEHEPTPPDPEPAAPEPVFDAPSIELDPTPAFETPRTTPPPVVDEPEPPHRTEPPVEAPVLTGADETEPDRAEADSAVPEAWQTPERPAEEHRPRGRTDERIVIRAQMPKPEPNRLWMVVAAVVVVVGAVGGLFATGVIGGGDDSAGGPGGSGPGAPVEPGEGPAALGDSAGVPLALADSAAADSLAPDSLPADSLVTDTVPADSAPQPLGDTAAGVDTAAVPPDTAPAPEVLAPAPGLPEGGAAVRDTVAPPDTTPVPAPPPAAPVDPLSSITRPAVIIEGLPVSAAQEIIANGRPGVRVEQDHPAGERLLVVTMPLGADTSGLGVITLPGDTTVGTARMGNFLVTVRGRMPADTVEALLRRLTVAR